MLKKRILSIILIFVLSITIIFADSKKVDASVATAGLVVGAVALGVAGLEAYQKVMTSAYNSYESGGAVKAVEDAFVKTFGSVGYLLSPTSGFHAFDIMKEKLISMGLLSSGANEEQTYNAIQDY